ncbi:ribonuclease-3 [Flavobacterium sp. PL11]|jgi:ribonuclease-3|uniref:ribonuclease III n=1 Tax=Flavobacterium sp. PL11 TaxID=3071717 RepID=UPI002DFBC07E|nr:ribonuclease-3 [Flavobacterium sp. PL11]
MRIIRKIFSKSRSLEDGIFFDSIQTILGFKPIHLEIYKKAFTHRSANRSDNLGNPMNYERLEFLGDAMLSSVIAAYLFDKSPLGDEGYLTKMRSKIVSREHLNELGKDLNLAQYIESKVPIDHFGDNLHGNIFESLIGAIYLDRGYTYCEKFIKKRVVTPYIDIVKLEGKVISYKSLIIEWCQKEKRMFHYDIFEDNGINGERLFGVKLSIDDKVIAKARATSKKKAEEKASQRAYFAFQEKMDRK